jgi:hypothetical protein
MGSNIPIEESIVHVQNQWMGLICSCYSSSTESLSNEKPTKLVFFQLKHLNGIKKNLKSAPAILSSFDIHLQCIQASLNLVTLSL